jgi:uncharacterized protein
VAALYLDTSALGRILSKERVAPAIRSELRTWATISSRLLAIELRRLGHRLRSPDAAEVLLAEVPLLPIDEPILTAAESVRPTGLGTLDAIHLATALRLHRGGDLGAILTYDHALADAARGHGIDVLAPGA